MIEQTSKQTNIDKQALFDLILKKKGINAPQTTKIPQTANGGPLPLSDPQQRIWSLYQLNPESPAYHMRLAQRITGSLDKNILSRALQTIANRHHILRSAFPEFEGRPQQILIPDFTFPLTTLDLQDQAPGTLDPAVSQTMTTFIQIPFNIQEGPLVRALLLKLAPEQHILLLVFHQIVFDGASSGLFLHELTTLYEAVAADKEAALPELTIQYADYTLWQQEHLQPHKLAPQRDYWQQRLAEKYKPLSLPTNRSRPPRETFSGHSTAFSLSPDLVTTLKQLSQRQGVTLFATMLAGFNTLLYAYSSQEDILVFTSAEGRVMPQLEPLIGLFSKQLPLRTNLNGRPTFRELVSRINQTIKDAFANQDIPFSDLVDMIRLAPGTSPASLFQAMFIFQNQPRPDLAPNGLRLEPMASENLMAKFDWRLQMIDQGQEIIGWLEYKTDLFDQATIDQVIGHFQQILTSAAQNPDQDITALTSTLGHNIGRSGDTPTQPPVNHTYVDPRDKLELTLKRLWEEAFSLAPIGIHDDFFELGGHSLLAVRLLALIEEQTGRNLPLATLFSAPTIAQIAELIRDDNLETGHSCLIPIKPQGARTPFFFVPPAGTTVLKYAGWSSLLDEEQPFYGLEPLGLEADETPQRTVEEMAKYYLQYIQSFQPQGPYILGGQCFGGLVAFEMARRLIHQGQEVAMLAIIDTELPPRKPSSQSGTGRPHASLITTAQKIINFPWNTYVFFRKTLKRTRATRMWAHKNPIYLLQNIAIWRRYSQTLQAHLDARVNYIVPDTYPGKISLLEFSTSDHEQKDGRWEWDDLARGGLDVHIIADDEAARQSGAFSQHLRQWLAEHLDQAHN